MTVTGNAGDFRDETETESETIPQRKHVFKKARETRHK